MYVRFAITENDGTEKKNILIFFDDGKNRENLGQVYRLLYSRQTSEGLIKKRDFYELTLTGG